MGYWVDMDDAYRTMDPDYIESVWWSLQADLRQGPAGRGLPGRARAARAARPALSDHELAQGYETVVDPSVYVRFPLTSGPLAGRAALLVWTTTPWTLVSNTAVAVHPDVTYVVATDGTEQLVVAEPLLGTALGEGWTVDRRALHRRGAGALDATGRPFDLVDDPGRALSWSSPTTSPPKTAPAWCTRRPPSAPTTSPACRAYGLPVVNPVAPGRHLRGRACRWSAGMFFKNADAALVADLQSARPAVPRRRRTSTATRTAGAATPR